MSEGNITIYVKTNEAIERALKRFKKKFDRIGVSKKLRGRAQYKKPSLVRREEKLKAIYKQQMETRSKVAS